MRILLLLLLAAAAPAPQGAGAPPAAPAPAAQAASGAATAPAADSAPAAIPLEAWRFNARERTARGLVALEKQQNSDAVAALDSAARLRPDDPLATYNAGTAHLAAGLGDAETILERALRSAPEELAADGFYNLGNARYAAKNAAGAVDAFKETLRREPGHAGARRNLELALKLLEEQQKQQQQQQQQQQGGESGGDQGSEGENPQGEGDGDDESQQPGQSGQGEGEPREEPGAAGGSQTGAGSERERPLPQFRDQEDMTAEQAAAILQAVENLERERRREDAKNRARAKSSVEKDW